MPGLAVRPKWAPYPPVGVDRAHPLAQDLEAYILPAWALDVTGRQAVFKFGTPTPDVTDMGRALSGWSSSSYLQVGPSATPILGNLAAWSVTAVFQTTNVVGAGSRPLYAERTSVVTANDILALETGIGASGVIPKVTMTYRDDAGTLVQTPGATIVNDGRAHVATFTRAATVFTLYVGGVLDAQTTSAGMTTNFTGSVTCNVGYNLGAQSPIIGQIAAIILHSRTLSAAEAAALALDPFAMLRRTPAVTGPSTLFVLDSFTGSNGTQLANRVPDVGASWGSVIASDVLNGSGKLTLGTASEGFASNNTVPSSPNYSVQAEFTPNAGSVFFGVQGRSSYGLLLLSGSSFGLLKGQGATGLTSPVTPAGGISTSETYRMKLTMSGSSITGTVQRLSDGNYLASDGSWQSAVTVACSATDSTTTTAGLTGMYHTASAGTVDNFQAF